MAWTVFAGAAGGAKTTVRACCSGYYTPQFPFAVSSLPKPNNSVSRSVFFAGFPVALFAVSDRSRNNSRRVLHF